MRKHLLCAVALGLAAIAAPAAAQDSNTVYLRTTVPSFCQATLALQSTSLNLGDLTDQNGFLVSAFAGQTQTQTAGAYYCNAPANVTVSASPLTVSPAVTVTDAAFTDHVDYRATVTWDNVSGFNLSSAGTPTVIASSEANTGPLQIQISNPTVDGAVRPVAGNYAGAVTVTVALQP